MIMGGVAVDSKKAKETTLGILTHPAVGGLRFTLLGQHVSPALYASVAKAIMSGRIAVIHEPRLNDIFAGGLYAPEADALMLPFSEIAGSWAFQRLQEATIIHECTHAGFDISRTAMFDWYNEVLAYVAGYLFVVLSLARQNIGPDKFVLGHSGLAENAALQAGLSIAKSIYKGHEIVAEDYINFDKALSIHPLYNKKGTLMSEVNGLARSLAEKRAVRKERQKKIELIRKAAEEMRIAP